MKHHVFLQLENKFPRDLNKSGGKFSRSTRIVKSVEGKNMPCIICPGQRKCVRFWNAECWQLSRKWAVDRNSVQLVGQQQGCFSQFCLVPVYCVIPSEEVIPLNEANFILRFMRIIISDLLYLRENWFGWELYLLLFVQDLAHFVLHAQQSFFGLTNHGDGLLLIDLPGNMSK